MLRPVSIGALAAVLLASLAAHASAQYPEPRNSELNKKASDFVTAEDAAAILGTSVEMRGDGVIQCQFKEPSDINRPGFDKVLTFAVRYWDPPLPNDLAMRKQNLAQYPAPGAIVTELPDFADAALWVWVPGYNGTLYAFQGGTIAVEVTLTGFPEDVSLQDAKLLAARPLGGSAGTGFVYDGSLRSRAQDAAIADTVAGLEARWNASRANPAPTTAASSDAPATADTSAMPSTPSTPSAPSAPGPSGPPKYSEAAYITQADFLHELKEVRLSIDVPHDLSNYITDDQARADVVAALQPYGISVVPSAYVQLQVKLLYNRMNVDWRDETYRTHEFLLSLSFVAQVVVRRHDTFCFLDASVASDRGRGSVFEANEIRKAFFGDELTPEMQQELPTLLHDTLASIAANTSVDHTRWAPDDWSDEKKAAEDAAFLTAMNESHPLGNRFEGIDSRPVYGLIQSAEDSCPGLAEWEDLWNDTFHELGWVKEPESVECPLMLAHVYTCQYIDTVNVPQYYRTMTVMQLKETNAVFAVNNRLRRKPVALMSWFRLDAALEEDLGDLRDNIGEQIDGAVDDIRDAMK